jgi:hypothetical protein
MSFSTASKIKDLIEFPVLTVGSLNCSTSMTQTLQLD